MRRLLFLLGLYGVIGGCGTLKAPVAETITVPIESVAEEVPPPTADPVWFPEPVVQAEFLSMRGNGRYRVGQAVYHAWDRVEQYLAEGTASRRDELFDTHKTIGGEEFQNEALTAAHRHLPIPSYVRVTNLANNERTVVRVNDRGPFRSDDVIDLSRAAALRLGFGDAISRPVRIELVTEGGSQFILETNYVYGRDAAMSIMSRLTELNLGHLRTVIVPHQYKNRFRVKIEVFASVEDANYVANWLSTNLQLGSSLLKE